MPKYLLYFLQPDGAPAQPTLFEVADDREALRQADAAAEGLAQGWSLELWQMGRLIARLPVPA